MVEVKSRRVISAVIILMIVGTISSGFVLRVHAGTPTWISTTYQFYSNTDTTNPGVVTVSVQSGDLIIAMYAVRCDTGSISAITDTQSNPYTHIGTTHGAESSCSGDKLIDVYYAFASATGSVTVSMTVTNLDFRLFIVDVYRSVVSVGAHTLSGETNPGTPTSFSVSITTSVNGAVLIDRFRDDSITGTSGQTLRSASQGSSTFDRQVGNAGAYTETFNSGDGYWAGVVIEADGTAITTDYSLSNDGPLTVQVGTTGIITITATFISGLASTTSLSCISLPSGFSCAFSPTSITVSSGTPTGTSVLTLSVANTVGVGTYTFQVTGNPLGATTTPTTVTVHVTGILGASALALLVWVILIICLLFYFRRRGSGGGRYR